MKERLLAVAGLTVVFAAAFIVARDVVGPPSSFPRAKAFEAPGVSGGTLGPQSYAGSVVLVNFWATYCVPCVDEMPSLQRVWRDYQDQGLVVLAVSIDEAMPAVTAFQSRFALSFPMAHDPGSSISRSWGTVKVPETYLIARNGDVRAKIVGAIDWTGPGARKLIEDLLRERT